MITKLFVEEIKHIITSFVNVNGQYMMTYIFSVRGFGHLVLLKPHFGQPVMKILAKTLAGSQNIWQVLQ